MSDEKTQMASRPERELYSPRISAQLIPVLYHTAKAKTMPMTTLVDMLLYKALAVEPVPASARERLKEVTLNFGESTLDDVPELESDLEKLLLASDAAPFAKEQEIDAWYRGSKHGLVRLHRMHQQSGILDDKRAKEHAMAMDLLRVFRNDARRMVAKRDA